MDAKLTQWVNAFAGQNGLIDIGMTWITNGGMPVIILYVVVLWWLTPHDRHVRHICFSSGLAFVAGQAINQLLILMIHRPRPYDSGVTRLIIERSADWSFPSDHATAAAAIALAFLLYRQWTHGMVLASIAILVSFSRVFLGTHFATDVLGGIATGFVAACFARAIYREGTRFDRAVTGFF